MNVIAFLKKNGGHFENTKFKIGRKGGSDSYKFFVHILISC